MVSTGDGIGASLRHARRERGIGLDEVERVLKVRRKYLSAIEQERWRDLPGGSYTRAYIRSFGDLVGLDGGLLADRYARSQEPDRLGSHVGGPVGQGRATHPARAQRSAPAWLASVLIVIAVAIAVSIALVLSNGITT